MEMAENDKNNLEQRKNAEWGNYWSQLTFEEKLVLSVWAFKRKVKKNFAQLKNLFWIA